MIYQVKESKLSGSIYIVPSKSLMHRALIAASLADGESTIYNPLYAIDTLQTIEGLKGLGVLFETRLDKIGVLGGEIRHVGKQINARESGSTLRFLIPVSTITGEKETFLLGDSLARRPMKPFEDIFKEKGLFYEQKDNTITCKGPLIPGDYIVPGDVSSQFISGLLFALPLLKDDSKIVIKGDYESKSYVDMTIDVLKRFNIKIEERKKVLYIRGNQKYIPTDFVIEGDYSQAASFLVANALGHEIKLKGLPEKSLQGDKAILGFLKDYGCDISIGDSITLKKVRPTPENLVFDISNSPDLGPILFALAALSDEKIIIKGIKRLRYKESDRVKAMTDNLELLGSKFEVEDNQITFYPSVLKGGITVNSFNDHRIAMSLAIIATVLEDGLIIEGADAVSKSYPTFFEDMRHFGGKTNEVKK
ncbi:MAG: 3-phosphoshikimate 1-carboxyvinyltransferase [Acholeplasmataceae bacterium]